MSFAKENNLSFDNIARYLHSISNFDSVVDGVVPTQCIADNRAGTRDRIRGVLRVSFIEFISTILDHMNCNFRHVMPSSPHGFHEAMAHPECLVSGQSASCSAVFSSANGMAAARFSVSREQFILSPWSENGTGIPVDLVIAGYIGSGSNIEAMIESMKKLVDPMPDDPSSKIWTITRDPAGGYSVTLVGTISDPLICGNYSYAQNAAFRRISSEYMARNPAGLLSVLHGPPGTGKTHFIRGLIHEIGNKATCLIVPSHLTKDLAGPDLLSALIDSDIGSSPKVIILEDADDSLLSRAEEKANPSALSSLLNLSDGILGSALKLRFIATTNRDLGKIDPAIMRPGRLLENVFFGTLDDNRAVEIAWRVASDRGYVRNDMDSEYEPLRDCFRPTESGGLATVGLTLADVYFEASKFADMRRREPSGR